MAYNLGLGSLTWVVATEVLPIRLEARRDRDKLKPNSKVPRLDSHPGQPNLQPLLVCRHQDVQRSAGLARPRCPLFPLWWSLSLWPRLHLYLPSRDSRQDSGGNGSKLSKTQSSPDSGTLRCLQVCKQDNSKPYKLASKGQLQFVQKLCIYFYIPVLHALYCDKNQIYCLDSRHQLIQSQNKLK